LVPIVRPLIQPSFPCVPKETALPPFAWQHGGMSNNKGRSQPYQAILASIKLTLKPSLKQETAETHAVESARTEPNGIGAANAVDGQKP
jgi:hypothetical protein